MEGGRFTAGPLEDRTRYQKLTSDLSAGEKDELDREEAARRHRSAAVWGGLTAGVVCCAAPREV